ncbi:MAG: YcxB family protein [Sediminibacterium sp.]|nr:YcxB family protein [Sediminibacterium sp.]
MKIQVIYHKNKVMQALRYHFIQRTEIRILMIVVNVFAIASAGLFYWKLIRPEPFLLGSLIWLGLMAAFWYIMPRSIYAKSPTFRDAFTVYLNEQEVQLENDRGAAQWEWKQFSRYFESPHFFHLYFSPRSFFLLPKEGVEADDLPALRKLLQQKIGD